MMRPCVFGGALLKKFLRDHDYLFPLRPNPELLQTTSLVVIQNEYEQGGSRHDGKELIFDLRLKYRFTRPVVLVYDLQLPGSEEMYSEVLRDPFVIPLEFDEMVNVYSDPGALRELFDLKQREEEKEDIDLLYSDLRQTIYRQGGYVMEVKHGLFNRLSKMRTGTLAEAFTLVDNSRRIINRILVQWKLKDLSAEWVQEQFEGCRSSSNLQELKSEVSRIFREIEVRLERVSSRTPEPAAEPLRILYIGDNEENHRQLQELFVGYYEFFHIKCGTVSSEEEAMDLLREDPEVRAVLCDYRFHFCDERFSSSDEKVNRKNGYHILKNLKKKFPYLYYAMFTNFSEEHTILPPGFTSLDFFLKREALGKNRTEFFRLAKTILRKSPAERGRWPNALRTKADEQWRAQHDEILLKREDYPKLQRDLGAEAADIVNRLGRGDRSAFARIPRVASPLGRLKEDVFQGMIDRLLVRRIIIGLYNHPDLINRYRQLTQSEHLYRAKLNEPRARFNIIYQLLQSKKGLVDFPGNRRLSNFFGDNYRIKISKDYSLDNAKLLDLITLAEHRWLLHLMEHRT